MKTQLFSLVAALALSIPAAHAARMAVPGTINYAEGEVTLDGAPVGTHQSGDLAMSADQVLSTTHGKAEVLLSPGAYLRMGDNSSVRMVAPGLSDPRVEVLKGEAMLEVDYKPKQAGLDVMTHGADAQILKEGIYRFDADRGIAAVIDGKEAVALNGKSKEIGKGKELMLNGEPLKSVSFDRKTEDDLYRWSDVRSSYLAEVNAASARTVYVNGGWGMGYGPGWFWNPWFSSYAWLPGDGYFVSPFGYPFYSPGFAFYGGRRFYGYGGARAFAPHASGFAAAPRVGGGFRGRR